MKIPQGLVRATILLGAAPLLIGCASVPKIQYDFVPPGSLRLGQVVAIAPKPEFQSAPVSYRLALSAGIPEAEIKDGGVAQLRIFCCGGSVERTEIRVAYVPPGLSVEPGDIVEFRTADRRKSGRAQLHTVIQIRQKLNQADGPCRWVPPQEGLWMRILYADWMPKEGWRHQGGISPAWYKPPPD